MSEKKRTGKYSPRAEGRRRGREFDAAGGREGRSSPDGSPAMAADEDLQALLDSWQSPQVAVPASLDARVLNSYRELLKEKEMNLHQRPSEILAPQYALPAAALGGAHVDYQLTILEERGLLTRLLAEMRETARDA
jgi:hypothetical protein